MTKILHFQDGITFYDTNREIIEKEIDPNLFEFPAYSTQVSYIGFEEDDKIVGCLTAFIMRGNCTIENLFVLPDYRKRGIASDMIANGVMLVKEKVPNCKFTVLAQDESFGIFQRLGFHVQKFLRLMTCDIQA